MCNLEPCFVTVVDTLICSHYAYANRGSLSKATEFRLTGFNLMCAEEGLIEKVRLLKSNQCIRLLHANISDTACKSDYIIVNFPYGERLARIQVCPKTGFPAASASCQSFFKSYFISNRSTLSSSSNPVSFNKRDVFVYNALKPCSTALNL